MNLFRAGKLAYWNEKLFLAASHKTGTQLFRYLIVGGTAALVDWSLYWLLLSSAGLNYLLSAFASFTFAAMVNYFLCVAWVFTEHRYRRGVEAGLTLFVGLIGLLFNQFFLFSFHELLALHFMVSKISATGIVFLWRAICVAAVFTKNSDIFKRANRPIKAVYPPER